MSDSRELAFAKEMAKGAGRVMRQNFMKPEDISWKADNSPLTVADTAINEMVMKGVHEHFPGASFVGEEGSEENGNDYRWLCDPVDGTAPFSMGIPTSVFTIGLAHHGIVQMGLVYDPYFDRMFWAERGKGAYLNGKRMQLPRAISGPRRAVDVEMVGHLSVSDIIDQFGSGYSSYRLHSVTYASMLVASGQMHGVIFDGSAPWDTAGVSLIIEEAGGIACGITGQPLDYSGNINGFVAGHPAIHEELMTIVANGMEASNKVQL